MKVKFLREIELDNTENDTKRFHRNSVMDVCYVESISTNFSNICTPNEILLDVPNSAFQIINE